MEGQKMPVKNDLLLDLFENSPDGILIVDQRVILDCNLAAVKMLAGNSKTDIIGKDLDLLSPPIQPGGRLSAETAHELSKLALKKKIMQFEWMHRDLDGRDFPVDVSVAVIPAKEKTLCFFIWRDLTEKGQRTEAHRGFTEFEDAIFEGLAEGIVIYDRNLCYLSWNPFMERVTGLTADQVLGLHAPSQFTHLSAHGLNELLRRALAGETVTSPDILYTSPLKAAAVWLSALYSPYRNSSGEIIGVIGLMRDVTERRQTEQALRDSEEKNRLLSELAIEGIMIHRAGGVIEANKTFARLLGYDSPEAVIGRNVFSFVTPDYVETVERKVREGEEGLYRVEIQRKDGSIFPAEFNVRGTLYRGEAARVVTLRDIAEHQRDVEALRSAEERYRRLFENATVGIFQTTLEGKVLDVNPALAAMHGFSSPQECIASVKDVGRQLYVNPEQRRGVLQLLEKQGDIHGLEVNFYRKDRSKIWVSMNVRQVRDAQGNVLYLEGITQDITERKGMEEALLREKERFRSFVEESPFGVSVIGSDGRYQYINPKFTEMFGYTLEDVPNGREWFRKAHPDPEYRHGVIAQWGKYVQSERKGETPLLTFQVTCKDGTEKSIQYRPMAMGTGDFLIMYEDFTERKRLEEQLRQSEKLEAIGTLAGGIAHDFNNLLMGIQGYTSILQHSLGTGHRDHEKLNQIQKLIQNGADLTQQLLGFARVGKYEIKPTDLNDIIVKSSTMFGRTRKNIVISCDLEEPLWLVEVDRSQIEQVLLNLYVNAGQAMSGGGQLSLATKNYVLNETMLLQSSMEPGNYVCITIADTGVGMDEKTRQRIFEPFFTTREMSRGAGLGLASAYGIIQGHGGSIDVDSEKGRGTTFRIYLPASDKEVPGQEQPAAEVARGHETILLVDDEDINIEVVREILEMLGYQVATAQGGQDAVDLFQEKKGAIDLVILDMIMPGMGGGDTFDALKGIDPEVKVILSSGYSLHGEAARIMERGCSAFIQKPYRIEELAGKLEEVLGRKP